MGICRGLFVIFTVLVVIVAVLLYSHVPEYVEDKFHAHALSVAFKLLFSISPVVSTVTGIPETDVMKTMSELPYKWMMITEHPDATIRDLNFEGIPVRMFRPNRLKGDSPCIIFIHGGGWSLFSVDSYHNLALDMALNTNTVVISIAFRKSPKYPYPIPFDDCLKATRHILQNGREFGINTKKVGISGDSCGGNLAAAVALRISEEDIDYIPHLRFQVLLYPMLQAISFNTPSYRQNANHTINLKHHILQFTSLYFGLNMTSSVLDIMSRDHHISPRTRKSIFYTHISEDRLPKKILQNYVPSSISFKDVLEYNLEISSAVEHFAIDPFVSPLLAEDLSKVPPAFILVVESDVLRDDGLFFASRLKEANVETEVYYSDGGIHSFMNPPKRKSMLEHKDTEQAWKSVYNYIKQNVS